MCRRLRTSEAITKRILEGPTSQHVHYANIETATSLGLAKPRMAPHALAKGFETLFLGLLLLRVRAGLTNFDARLAALGDVVVHSDLFGMAPPDTTRDTPRL